MLDVLLVALAAGLLVATVYSYRSRLPWIGDGPTGAAPEAETATTVSERNPRQYDIDAMVSAHLFGEVVKQQAKPVSRAPETKLQLRLLGMIASGSDQYARALISVNSRQVDTYGVGEAIAGTDARIRAVERRRVLLNRNGAVESLLLKTPKLPEESVGRPAPAGAASDEARAPTSGGAGTAGAEESSEIRYGGVKEPTGKSNKLPF